MMARLTATILSLCIALPMCWCCTAAEPRQEAKSCCARSQSHAADQAPQLPQDKNCPCARHEAMRDVAATIVKVPVPELKLLSAPLWLESTLETVFVFHVETIAPRLNHGPPPDMAPVYARHCALLI